MTRPVPEPRTRDIVRRSVADQLLGALDDLVARHRALACRTSTSSCTPS
jgi:hypothetical protein